MKSIVAAVAVLAASGVHAAPWDLSQADFNTQANFTKQVTFAGDTAIEYEFTFGDLEETNILVGLTLAETALGSWRDINFTSITVTDGTNTYSLPLSSETDTPLPGGGTLSATVGSVTTFSLNGATLGPDFTMTLEGAAVGTGDITGSYTLTVTAAVPEPETYALALGGLGVLAWAARRRKV